MSDPHVFDQPEITVTWSKRRCTHAAECIARLPQVFEPGRKPWITPETSEADRIAEVITHCPTGALQFVRHDGGAAETPDAENTVRVERYGPLVVRGTVEVATEAGTFSRETRVSLCRCGFSRNRPFCDGAHREARFRDNGEVFEGRIEPPGPDPKPLTVTARADGPLKLTGKFTIVSADGRVKIEARETALCRCGHSRNKPFCDSSHKVAGFTAAELGGGEVAPS